MGRRRRRCPKVEKMAAIGVRPKSTGADFTGVDRGAARAQFAAGQLKAPRTWGYAYWAELMDVLRYSPAPCHWDDRSLKILVMGGKFFGADQTNYKFSL